MPGLLYLSSSLLLFLNFHYLILKRCGAIFCIIHPWSLLVSVFNFCIEIIFIVIQHKNRPCHVHAYHFSPSTLVLLKYHPSSHFKPKIIDQVYFKLVPSVFDTPDHLKKILTINLIYAFYNLIYLFCWRITDQAYLSHLRTKLQSTKYLG